MRIARFALRSLNDVASLGSCRPILARTLSTNAAEDPNSGSSESPNEFERRIFGGISDNDGKTSAFFQHLGRAEKARDWRGGRFGGSSFSGGSMDMDVDDIDEGFDALSDGMEGKLKEAAKSFKVDEGESTQDGYSFRPDFTRGANTYTPKNLDLTRPGLPRGRKYEEFVVTTEEVLKKADFRNVRFLAHFITQAGIIIKRKQTGISAKAQRKIAREIKTARAFGLMPFTSMGTKAFIFGRSMESRDEDFQFETIEDDEVDNTPV